MVFAALRNRICELLCRRRSDSYSALKHMRCASLGYKNGVSFSQSIYTLRAYRPTDKAADDSYEEVDEEYHDQD